MKIALVTTSFLPKIGGAEFVVHYLAHHWAKQRHEVCVFNPTTDDSYFDDNYEVKRYRALRGGTRFGHHRWPFRTIDAMTI